MPLPLLPNTHPMISLSSFESSRPLMSLPPITKPLSLPRLTPGPAILPTCYSLSQSCHVYFTPLSQQERIPQDLSVDPFQGRLKTSSQGLPPLSISSPLTSSHSVGSVDSQAHLMDIDKTNAVQMDGTDNKHARPCVPVLVSPSRHYGRFPDSSRYSTRDHEYPV